jgi:hypothetical protein
MGCLPGLRPELHLRLVDNPTDAVETIALHTVKTAEDMKRSFVSLRGDPERVGALRQRYGAMARGPLIGLSWTSKNTDSARSEGLGAATRLGAGDFRHAAILAT